MLWIVGILLVLIVWSAYGYLSTKGIERPVYTVVRKAKGYEVRTYEPYIVAEANATGKLDTAIRTGFELLAGYIFGNNESKTSIRMTAPVGTRAASETIAMTTPVGSVMGNGSRTITFTMPKKYTMETLPVPKDPRVTLREVPARTVAARSFSFSRAEGRTVIEERKLRDALKRDGVSVLGTAETAFYDPPWTPPFMLHSEILIPVES